MKRNKPLIFNPDEEPKDMLIATFVIRQPIFEKVFKGIKDSSRTTPPQHFLLVGQRGMGKTTLLLRIKYAIEDDPELADYLLLVRFPEEQYNIGGLPDLWEETALYLENLNPLFEGLSDDFKPHEKKDDYERICFELLTKKLKQHNKRIVFLIDNIGDLLHKFTDQENSRFREILMTSPYLQLIGASSGMLEYSFHYDKPFFEFFYQLKLEPVNRTEAVNLMKALAETYDVTDKITTIINQSPERIEALRRITGGVPRTLVLLFEIFIDYNDGSAFEDLEHLVDKVLPLYKARMDSLKPQQQKIIDALARAWEAIPVSDVLEQSKLYRENITSNQVSSQLKQLEDNQLVETVDIGKRKKLYRIRERFFNIWYLMRNGRKQNKEQVLWLIRFLESWCTVPELHDIARKQIESIGIGKYSEKAAYYKAMALHNIDCLDAETKQELLKHTENYLLKAKKHDWANTIHKLIEESDNNWLKKAIAAYQSGDIEMTEKLMLQAVAESKKGSEYTLGLFYRDDLKDYDKAEIYFLRDIEKGNTYALSNLANFYYNIRKDYDKAEEYYLKDVDKGYTDALFNLAYLYNEIRKDYDKAEEYYIKAIEKGNTHALINLALLYDEVRKDYDKAEEYYLKAIEKDDTNAPFFLALLYDKVRKDYDKAEKYYLKNNEKENKGSLLMLGIFYAERKQDITKAEKYFLQAFSLKDFRAVNLLISLYWNNSEHQKALDFLTNIFQQEDFFEKELGLASQLLISLLAEEQYNFLLNEFKKENSLLMKYLQPMYYVVAWYLKDELPGEYEKTGSEIKETVDEIIRAVEERKAASKS